MDLSATEHSGVKVPRFCHTEAGNIKAPVAFLQRSLNIAVLPLCADEKKSRIAATGRPLSTDFVSDASS